MRRTGVRTYGMAAEERYPMSISELTGLTWDEAAEKAAQGKINITKNNHQKTTWQIVRSHTITYFNILNFFLAGLIILSGQLKNILFIGVVFCNAAIGIVQELRVKKLIDRLSVITAARATVLREGEREEIPIDEIVEDDVVILSPGDQLAADGEVLVTEGLEVNESMLTGESKPVKKAAGDEILSGSFITAGTGAYHVSRVGDATYASTLVAKAQTKKRATSEMQNTIGSIIRVISILIIPLGLLLFRSQYLSSGRTDMSTALVHTVSGVIGMIPEGLVLLTSVSFILGVGRLARKQALVQEMEAIEALARVDVLCTDKTGTITTGDLMVMEVVPVSVTEEEAYRIFAEIGGAFDDVNATQAALDSKFGKSSEWTVRDRIPFSSARKYRAVSFEEHGDFVLGAPEFLVPENKKFLTVLEKYSAQGYRVLLLGSSTGIDSETETIGKVKPVCVAVISDIIKTDAADVFKYFADNGVSVKVISGDNPVTVSTVAKKAGVSGADKYVDASTLPADPALLKKEIRKYNIFGRVKPEQKQAFVRAWQEGGKTVAMVGDGVNDVLAIKDADCGIAMAAGSEAAKHSAHIVLLDSDFMSMKSIVKEGREIISNIERVSSLYLTKTIYSVILVFIYILLKRRYPFTTLQMGLINVACIGLPSFLLTLEQQENLPGGGFLKHVLKVAAPGAFTMVTMMLLVQFLNEMFGWNPEVYSTFTLVLGGLVGLFIVAQVCSPMNGYHKLVTALAGVVMLLAILFLPGFYDIHTLWMGWSLLLIPLAVLAAMLIYWYSRLTNKFVKWFFRGR